MPNLQNGMISKQAGNDATTASCIKPKAAQAYD